MQQIQEKKWKCDIFSESILILLSIVEEAAFLHCNKMKLYYGGIIVFLLLPFSSSPPPQKAPTLPSSLPRIEEETELYVYMSSLHKCSFFYPSHVFRCILFHVQAQQRPFASQGLIAPRLGTPFIRAMAPSPKWPRNKRPLNQHKSKNKSSSS